MNYFKKGGNSFSEKKEVVTMKNILVAYSLVVKDDLYDFVPKCIISLYINELLEVIDAELSQRITKSGN